MPKWAVVGPPFTVDAILIITIAYLIIDGGNSNGGEIFKNVVTFCVSLLSASTVFIVSAVFANAPAPHPQNPPVSEEAKSAAGANQDDKS